MAIKTPPPIAPGPTPVIQRGDRATFSNRVDAFISWLVPGVAQFNALGENVAHNASETFTNSSAAVGAAQSALKSAETATAAAAAATGTLVVSTSASSITIGLGAKTFVTQAAKQFVVGVPIVAVNPADTSNRMYGTVTSYAGTSLVINVTSIGGGGTLAAWNLSIAGEQGAPGAGALSGNATAAINIKRGGDVAVSATPDIWGAGGNLVLLTGTGVITGFPDAPQAGATRRLIANGTPSFVSGANLIVKGGNCTMTAGDEAFVTAESSTRFLVTIIRQDGSATKNGAVQGKLTVLLNSAIFYVRKTGVHTVTLVGAGGSGAAASHNAIGKKMAVTGGGAGGLCILTFFATADQAYVFTRGAEGLARVATGAFAGPMVYLAGIAGGTSSFTGPGVKMTAGGGAGGAGTDVFYTNGVASTTIGNPNPLPYTPGGIASGGDLNYAGGTAGDAFVSSVPSATLSALAATGGGAVAYFGRATSSGSASAGAGIETAGYGAFAATGGASPGGNSGGAGANTAYGNQSGAFGVSGGAGAGGGTTGGASLAGGPGIPLIITPPLNCVYAGSGVTGPGLAPLAPLGCGSGGASSSIPGQSISVGGNGGLLSGGGAALTYAVTGCAAGSGGYGGGGGAAVAVYGQGITLVATSGAGGQAFCLIQEPA